LAPVSQLAAVVLGSLDELLFDEGMGVDDLDRLSKYQMRLLASFFDSARRGSLEDLSELVDAHAGSVAPSTKDRPRTRPGSLDDDYSSWKVLNMLVAPEHAQKLAEEGGEFVDDLLDGKEGRLNEDFTREKLLPFLDKLAHADEKVAMEQPEGWHSLHG
jgi:hypothetical protein